MLWSKARNVIGLVFRFLNIRDRHMAQRTGDLRYKLEISSCDTNNGGNRVAFEGTAYQFRQRYPVSRFQTPIWKHKEISPNGMTEFRFSLFVHDGKGWTRCEDDPRCETDTPNSVTK